MKSKSFLSEESKERHRVASVKGNKTKGKRCQDRYNADPKKCKCCKAAIIYEKRYNTFCSHNCSAKHNNIGIRRHGSDPCKQCRNCSVITKNPVFCSLICNYQWQRKQIIKQIENGEYKSPYSGNSIIRSYLLDKRGYRCESCGLKEWIKKPIPLSAHHIDGDATNNHPKNLQLICLNCHGLTDNFGVKNKNCTRTYNKTKRTILVNK